MTGPSRLTRRQWLSAGGLLALHGLAGCRRDASSEPIWIGHLARLGGKDAEAGERAIDAIQMTLAELGERDATIAGRSIGVRHVDAPTAPRARAEAARLLAVNRVACLVVGPGVEGVSEIAAVARAHGAAAVVLGEVADPTLADQAVLLGVDPKFRGEMLGRYAMSSGKGRRAIIVRDQGEKIAGLVAEGFTQAFERAGGKVEGKGAGKPDVILAAMNPARWITSATTLATPGVPVVYAGPLASAPAEVEQGSKKGECWWPTLQPDAAGLSADSRAWVERFEKRFRQKPNDDAVLAHDAVATIINALETIGSDDQAKLADELTGRKEFAGLTGTIVRKDGRPIRPLFLTRFVGGRRLPPVALPAP